MIAPLIAPLTPAELAHRQARAAYEAKNARYAIHMLRSPKRGCVCTTGDGWCPAGQALLDAADRAYVPREMGEGAR